MNNLTDNNWILSLGTFLPLLGALVIMFGTRRDDERTPKIIGIVTAGVTLAIGIVSSCCSTTTGRRTCSSSSTPSGSRSSRRGYTIGLDGISLPLTSCRWPSRSS